MYLLDVNVLIALCDQDHEHHAKAHRWFKDAREVGWRSTPITQNGAVRILGHPSYPNSTGSIELAALAISNLIQAVPTHRFLPDDVSILDKSVVPSLSGLGPAMLTDVYLLALAASSKSVFATFGLRINPDFVFGGREALLSI